MHRRKSSRDEDDAHDIVKSSAVTSVSFPDSDTDSSRTRVNSSPTHPPHINGHARPNVPSHPPSSAGPYRTAFVPARSPSLPTPNGHAANGIGRAPTSPLNNRTSPSHARTLSHSLTPTYIHSLNQPYGSPHGSAAHGLALNGHTSSAHSRTRSISTPFSPPISSPLASSFPPQSQSIPSLPTSAPPTKQSFPSFAASMAFPETEEIPPPVQAPGSPKIGSGRRHARLHSRNLSIFFPRPGSLPTNSIAEDGAQEVEVHVEDIEAPVSTIPSAESNVSFPRSSRQPPTPLGAGFTFGARAPPGELPVPTAMSRSSSTGSESHSRRGHHHKHSMSHNFFSFLEPGANGHSHQGEEELHTQPTLTPVSPWTPISPFPNSATSMSPNPSPMSSVGTDLPPQTGDVPHSHRMPIKYVDDRPVGLTGGGPKVVGVLQFVLGASLWVTGQQIGSLSSTGLGYWAVFDAFGIGIGVWGGKHLSQPINAASSIDKERIRRPYGNARVETVLMFAQAVYLMFSSVYVCKETVEHLLLSAGAGAGVGGGVGSGGHSEGHHHHHGGGEEHGVFVGIDFPIFLTILTVFTILLNGAVYRNHFKLLHITGNRIPSLGSTIRSVTRLFSRQFGTSYAHEYDEPPTSLTGELLSNPYICSPLLFAAALLCVALGVDGSQHQMCDLGLACLITVITFNVAYKASVVLGTVLLQTSPPRSSSAGGQMDAFLRVIKEIERHPQVIHLTPPHIWQLTPSHATSLSLSSSSTSSPSAESLVVTLELHVRDSLGDDDVLRLTRWAWEKCVSSLRARGQDSGVGDAEVTVGVVRG
ncbi:hypothetical protein CCMSSC00406_0008978 [Pleurotus cornucopiae]|uniref:Uncharacterized protein n=1 Tax=Pleurotus cornucopiae TaxID=5321 RepID=A0ACB7JA92_PLECO|nr:hypothetical protein CCMSSC00406_0008978 [Pleurotus cornucopiae]